MKTSLIIAFQFAFSYAAFAQANDPRPVVVVSGMTAEASIARGHGVINVLSGGSPETLKAALDRIDPAKVKAVISFGVAGALNPRLKAGDIVVATSITNDDGVTYSTSPKIVQAILAPLRAWDMHPRMGRAFGSNTGRYDAASKSQLWHQTGDLSVDMESQGAAKWAAEHGVPFGMVRTISDPQSFTLPPLAAGAVNPDGTYNMSAIMDAILQDPSQLGALIETGFDALSAFENLENCRNLVRLQDL